jgi:hypothetical protein
LLAAIVAILANSVLFADAQPRLQSADLKLSTTVFSTYLGGEGTDDCDGVAVDGEGNSYLGCHLNSPELPGSEEYPYSIAGGMDAFVIKLNPSASAVAYIAHLGGSEWDAVQDLATDAEGNVYAVGTTYSADFPVSANAVQTDFGGGSDAFVVKLDAKGAVIWATFFGGKGDEDGRDIVPGSDGNVHIIGPTTSTDNPITSSALQSKSSGGSDAFIASFDPEGKLIYSTYLGGSGDDIGFAIAVDATGRRHIAGTTNSTDFPVYKSLYPTHFGDNDAFVTVLNAAGSAIEFSSYLGGSGSDEGIGIGLTPQSDIIIAGQTNSPDLPASTNSIQNKSAQAKIGGNTDAFIAQLNITKPTLTYLTYLGGNARERTRKLVIDPSGRALLVGETSSLDFPSSGNEQIRNNNADKGFAILVNDTGTQFPYTFLSGGSKIDAFESAAFGADGSLTIVGLSSSSDFPTVAPLQSKFLGGRFDIVVLRLLLSR